MMVVHMYMYIWLYTCTCTYVDDGHACVFTIPLHGRLCQILNLDPRPVLIAEVLFSNIGGTATGRCRCVYVCVCLCLCFSVCPS